MSCKYKKFDKHNFCHVINSECQFMMSPYDNMCPILAAFIDYDSQYLNTNVDENNSVKIDSMIIEDKDLLAKTLNIKI